MTKSTEHYPALSVDAAGPGVVSHAGSAAGRRDGPGLGLAGELSSALAPWRKPLAVYDPAKVFYDLALSLVVGGD